MRLYITTAIDYVNSRPHIGTAYEKIGADVLARFYRLLGWEVRFQMGNDEHSSNVAKAAREKGLDPLVYCDQMEGAFRTTWQQLDIAYDGFIRTTAPAHRHTVETLFTQINARTAPDGSPNIYKAKYTGWYCDSCEAFYTEKDLQDQLCPLHKRPARWVEEENYFFALSRYRDLLLQHLRQHPAFILPTIRRNEILRLVEDGLQDISISREGGTWGIHLPIDARHTVYVWFDALINYLSAVGFGTDPAHFSTWWHDATVYHVIGKDITRFHGVIWPAMLFAAGLPLPTTIFGHGFVYHRGERMSKTLGNVVDPLALAEQYGADPLRYFLLRENSFGSDGNFTWAQFVDRYNGDLASGIGNLVSRTCGMITQYLQGVVPAWTATSRRAAQQLATIQPVHEAVGAAFPAITRALDLAGADIDFHAALAAIWQIIAAADRCITDNAPWKLHKAGRQDEVVAVLGTITDVIAKVTILLTPFVPATAEKIWHQMGYEALRGRLAEQQLTSETCHTDFLTAPLTLGPATPLFPRIESPKEDPSGAHNAKTNEGLMDITQITIDDFAKVHLQAATIAAAEPVEGADRLLKIQVDLGSEIRQIVAGIAKQYTPEELIGTQVCVVTNLKPAKLRGVESHGMLLAASDDTTISILTPLKPVANGSRVK